MAKILPFRRFSETREAVYQATNTLFSKHGVSYSETEGGLDPVSLLELVTGVTKTALAEETQLAYDESIETQRIFRLLWRKRTVSQKMGDLFAGRILDAVLPDIVARPRISDEGYVIHDRSLAGKIFIGKNKNLEPSDVTVTDRFIEGTLSVNGREFALNSDDRLIRVELDVHRSSAIHFDSKVTYTMYPDDDLVHTRLTKSFRGNLTSVSFPVSPDVDGLDLNTENMISAINGLGNDAS